MLGKHVSFSLLKLAQLEKQGWFRTLHTENSLKFITSVRAVSAKCFCATMLSRCERKGRNHSIIFKKKRI